MKKILIIIGGIIVFLIIIGVVTDLVRPTSNTETGTPETNQPTESQEPKENQTSEQKEKITISNSRVKPDALGGIEIVGEITNNDSIKHTVTLKATFYDKSSKILGTAFGIVSDLDSGKTKTFNLFTADDVKGYNTFKVDVDTLL